ncbi:MAG TPA: Rrf2 family transcriptional regulator [Bacteroidia bacterium]|nr:Rrf2 family transcriptional regulator [Bacteroidia bacterium]
MFTYSKLAQAGIAAVSYLAEIGGEHRLAGSGEIAEARELSRALVAKILTQLSAAGLVDGKPGPAGGYHLARDPAHISLLDVVRVFEDVDGSQVMCPFGPHWCGTGSPCPLHDTFAGLREQVLERLGRETFEQFVSRP